MVPALGWRTKPSLIPKTRWGKRRSLLANTPDVLGAPTLRSAFSFLRREQGRNRGTRGYSPERRMGKVGVVAPPAFSMVMPKALAAMPLGSGGSTSEA